MERENLVVDIFIFFECVLLEWKLRIIVEILVDCLIVIW